MLLSVLALGFLIGIQHAFEADHIAAVSSVVSRKTGLKSISRHGLFWGLGHSCMLLLVAGAALLLHLTLSARTAAALEFMVGIMLVGLGAQLLYRLWRERVHFHAHKHEDNTIHFHAHSHRGEQIPHAQSPHDHEHREGLPWRSFAIGLMHGLAGSAALVILASTTLATPLMGFIYIALFGLGSTAGMVVLSAIIAVPISYTAKSLTWTNRALQVTIGVFTIAIGVMVGQGSAAAFLMSF